MQAHMQALMLFGGSGPIVILTSHESATDPALVEKLKAKGLDKFIAHQIPLELARERYAGHFEVVMCDLRERDDLRVLDFNGERAFHLFHLTELGSPIMHEGETADDNA